MERWPEMDELYSVIMESSNKLFLHEFLYAIWYHLYNLKNVKNTQGRVLLLVKLKLFCGCLTCFFLWNYKNHTKSIAQCFILRINFIWITKLELRNENLKQQWSTLLCLIVGKYGGLITQGMVWWNFGNL